MFFLVSLSSAGNFYKNKNKKESNKKNIIIYNKKNKLIKKKTNKINKLPFKKSQCHRAVSPVQSWPEIPIKTKIKKNKIKKSQ